MAELWKGAPAAAALAGKLAAQAAALRSRRPSGLWRAIN